MGATTKRTTGHFKASRRANPFPGRQIVGRRRKLLAKAIDKIDLRLQELELPKAVTPLVLSGDERSQGETAREIEESRCAIADRISPEREPVQDTSFESGSDELNLVLVDEEESDESLFVSGSDASEFKVEAEPNIQSTAGKKREDQGSPPHFNELYYDESSGLIEVVGVPKPSETPADYMADVRAQVESMLAEWEAFDKSGKPFRA